MVTDKNFSTATSLMKMALALLDRSDDPDAASAACRLSAAIDLAEGNRCGMVLDQDLEARFLDRYALLEARLLDRFAPREP